MWPTYETDTPTRKKHPNLITLDVRTFPKYMNMLPGSEIDRILARAEARR
jgi:hypothetical protein